MYLNKKNWKCRGQNSLCEGFKEETNDDMSKIIDLNKNVEKHISQSESIFDEEEATTYKIPGMVEEYENIEELHNNIQLLSVEGITSEVPLEDYDHFDGPQNKNSISNLSKLENGKLFPQKLISGVNRGIHYSCTMCANGICNMTNVDCV